MFSSFMEKRNLQNKIYDEMIEDAKREEEEKRRKQESRWGANGGGTYLPGSIRKRSKPFCLNFEIELWFRWICPVCIPIKLR